MEFLSQQWSHHVAITATIGQSTKQQLAIFWPISLYGQSTFILVGHIYCTFAMEWLNAGWNFLYMASPIWIFILCFDENR